MTVVEFIEQVLKKEIGEIQTKGYPYLSFQLIATGIELLGACTADDYPFEERNLSGARFKYAITNYFSKEYNKHADTLYNSLRCGMVHFGVPKSKIGLTHEDESKNHSTNHLEKTNGRLVLVAEIFYKDFKSACDKVIKEIKDGTYTHKKLSNDFLNVPGDASTTNGSSMVAPTSGSAIN